MDMKLDSLDKLITAVEAGEWYGNTEFAFTHPQHMNAFKAFNGSLDAALALHNALLPGWGCKVVQFTNGRGCAAVAKYPVSAVDVFAETPSRAWILAILKAYRAHVPQKVAG